MPDGAQLGHGGGVMAETTSGSASRGKHKKIHR